MEFIVMMQVIPVPEHPPPDHPAKAEPEAAFSVRVTIVPAA